MDDKTNKGMGAVVGIILMVAIVVAISATVYVYVSGMLESNNFPRNGMFL